MVVTNVYFWWACQGDSSVLYNEMKWFPRFPSSIIYLWSALTSDEHEGSLSNRREREREREREMELQIIRFERLR